MEVYDLFKVHLQKFVLLAKINKMLFYIACSGTHGIRSIINEHNHVYVLKICSLYLG